MALQKGFQYLEDKGLIDCFCKIKIPKSWSEAKSVHCLDKVRFEVTKSIIIEDVNQIITSSDENEDGDDIKDELLKISGARSCDEFARYFYNLIVYVQDNA